jgi:20S proteasome alpha/beta subunit
MGTDMAVSTESFSADTRALKILRIADKWLCMYAGTISPVTTITSRIVVDINSGPKSESGFSDGQPESQVVKAFTDAFKLERKRIAEDSILSKYGMSLQEFISQGRGAFGDTAFEGIKYALEAIEIDVQFLVCGFSPGGIPSIFSIDDQCLPKFYQKMGFHAIGTGDVVAMGMLYNTLSWDTSSVEETIYRVMEAKFVAETAPGVGKTTVVQLLNDSGIGPIFTNRAISPIKIIWEKKGRPKLPKNALEAVKEMVALGTTVQSRNGRGVRPKKSKPQTIKGPQ